MNIAYCDATNFKVVGDVFRHASHLERLGCTYDIHQACYICSSAHKRQVKEFLDEVNRLPEEETFSPVESFQGVVIRSRIFEKGETVIISPYRGFGERQASVTCNRIDDQGVIYMIHLKTSLGEELQAHLCYLGWYINGEPHHIHAPTDFSL